MTKHVIIVLGSTNTDMVISGNRIPAPGETVSGGQFFMNPGGKGANQAVTVARLGEALQCVFIAKVGADLFGRDTAKRLQEQGIEARLIIDAKEPSGTALIFVDSQTGQNSISVALGANATLSPEEVRPILAEFSQAKALLMQLETPLDTVVQAAQMAHQAGIPVILNPAPAKPLPPELYPCLDWITPNESEAEILTGIPVTDAASAKQAASVLLNRGTAHVIITMGVKGCYASDTDTLYPCHKVQAVDCVAAGDTFNGAFAVALAEEMPLDQAISFAQKASAISVTRPGAQSSVPYRHEITSFFSKGSR